MHLFSYPVDILIWACLFNTALAASILLNLFWETYYLSREIQPSQIYHNSIFVVALVIVYFHYVFSFFFFLLLTFAELIHFMSENRSVVSNSGNPMDSTIHGILQVRILEKVAFPFLGDLPNSGIEHRSPALQGDSLPSEPQGKPKNTGVGSLSLLQWIFLAQESNHDLLHGRQILYQLSYQGGSPYISISLT